MFVLWLPWLRAVELVRGCAEFVRLFWREQAWCGRFGYGLAVDVACSDLRWFRLWFGCGAV